ncbi:glycosyltransferase family 39 protein [Roseivirga sp. E12]|uniref:ArnT family glycosyltransferase n=1 Tax=Roseivirga sp. E12 TaxID=2819237 RepID=UPI001ABBE321|nr:glycosyltransferase family 39 protein [Roseivirga sp. E12]MBO3698438.1 glycosyltransferase family 39 protein [Roseivirga sp. E12]
MSLNQQSTNHQSNKLFYTFLAVWFVIGLIQNYFTEVNGEEAYYWLFSQYLDWGYLDHPPMVGVVTAPGYWLMPNPLGLRLGVLIINILTMLVVWKTTEKRDTKLLIWIFVAMLSVHVGSYMVKTDVPLILGVALFYYFYKQYLKEDSLKTVAFLALSIALILMSKHHGILVVFFTVLSNVKLLTRKTFWMTVVFTVLLMLPHTYWQYMNDFATIKFHLYNRIDMGFSWENIAYYLGVQPLVFGPLVGVSLLAASYKNKTGSDFNRALKFTIVGVLIFFLVSTFKVEFHKHWTSVLSVPFMLLGHEYISKNEGWKKLLIRLSIVSIIIVIPARIYLAYDFFPKKWTEGWDVLHNWDTWANEIQELSGGLPIMFNNHYERSSRYAYLTKDIVHCYNTFDYRETHHDLLPLEENLQGKTVFQINRFRDTINYDDYFTEIRKGIHYRTIENFRSYRNVWIEIEDGEKHYDFKSGEQVDLNLILINKYKREVNFADAGDRQVVLNVHYLKGLKPVGKQQLTVLTGKMQEGQEQTHSVSLMIPDLEGDFDIRFSIQVGEIEPPINSRKVKVTID